MHNDQHGEYFRYDPQIASHIVARTLRPRKRPLAVEVL